MKTKLYFGILALILAFLSTFIEQTTVPNQQIVIQFSDKTISTEETENTIEAIEFKLHSIGVTQIQIGKNDNGQLRITYHSNTDVKYIKDTLFNSEDFNIAFNSQHNQSNNYPEQENIKDYELNISEIKTSNHINWDFEGTQVAEINQKTDHSNNLKVDYFGNQSDNKQTNDRINVAVLVTNSVAIAKGNNSYKTPEVRAGPTS